MAAPWPWEPRTMRSAHHRSASYDPSTRRPVDDNGRDAEVRSVRGEFAQGGRHRVGGMLLLLIERVVVEPNRGKGRIWHERQSVGDRQNPDFSVWRPRTPDHFVQG